MSFAVVRSFSEESDDDPLAVKERKTKSGTKSKYNGPKCSVKFCNNKKDDSRPEISFHRFPKSVALQKVWVERTQPPLSSNVRNRFVCSIHFEPILLRDYRVFKDSKRRLPRTAVPTLHLPPQEGPDPELPLPSEVEVEVDVVSDDNGDSEICVTQTGIDPSRDIEMVELSSDEEDAVPDGAGEQEVLSLSSADAVAAISTLQFPTRSTGGLQQARTTSNKQRSSTGLEKSPTKSVISLESSMDGSILSDEEGDDDDALLVPPEESDYIELEDPLEKAYVPTIWKNMNEKNRRAALRAYLSRIASYLPVKFARNSKIAILESAGQYLDEVTKNNAALAIEEEILLQKHYRLRNAKRRLEQKAQRRIR